MKFHENLICLELSLVKSLQDIRDLYSAVLGVTKSDNFFNSILKLKEDLNVRRIFVSKVGEVFFAEYFIRRGLREIYLSNEMIADLGSMKSSIPKSKGVGHGLVMIEIGRFTKEELSKFFVNNCGFDNVSEDIFNLKNKVSKVWVYMPSQEIIFFNKRGDRKIDISNIEYIFNIVQIFGNKKSHFTKDKKEVKKFKQQPILEMDAILDKISQFGMDSLIKEELDFLKSFS